MYMYREFRVYNIVDNRCKSDLDVLVKYVN